MAKDGSMAEYDFVRFVICDFLGRSRCKSVAAACVPAGLNHGIGVFSGLVAFGPKGQLPNISRIIDANLPNVNWKPINPTKILPVPWSRSSFKVGEVMCEPYWSDGSIQFEAPRCVLQRQIKELNSMGLHFKSAFEYELTLYTGEALTPVFNTPGVCLTFQLSNLEELLYSIASQLISAGIQVETIENEHSPGQVEFTFPPQIDMETSDNMFRFREALKEICAAKGVTPTFMAAPTFTDDGYNGCHLNFSLCQKKPDGTYENIVKVENGTVAETARYFIGGVLAHMDALTSFYSPTVNCYRRLHTTFVPSGKDWGFDDRTVSFRVVKGSEHGARIENRLPSTVSNPYIVSAATIAAGIHGIQERIEPPPPGINKTNVAPKSLKAALDALQADKILVDALGAEFVDWWVAEKRDGHLKYMGHHNAKGMNRAELDVEREHYFYL